MTKSTICSLPGLWLNDTRVAPPGVGKWERRDFCGRRVPAFKPLLPSLFALAVCQFGLAGVNDSTSTRLSVLTENDRQSSRHRSSFSGVAAAICGDFACVDGQRRI